MTFAEPEKLAKYLEICRENAHRISISDPYPTVSWYYDLPDTGYIVLDIDFDQYNRESVKSNISLLVHRLGIFDRFDFDDVVIFPKLNEEQSRVLDRSNATILCDMTGRCSRSLTPKNEIMRTERSAFYGDRAQIWKYTGSMEHIDPFRAEMFYASQLATVQVKLIMSLVGQIKVDNIVHAKREAFYDRLRTLFDSLLVGHADFPITKSEFEKLHDYLSFLIGNPEVTPYIMTTDADVLPDDPETSRQVRELTEMTSKIREVSQLWADACRASGSGVSNLASFSNIMLSEERMPLDVSMRKALAELIGVDSAIDAYMAGVPIEDIAA